MKAGAVTERAILSVDAAQHELEALAALMESVAALLADDEAEQAAA